MALVISEHFAASEYQHVYRGLKYAESVVSGDIPAGNYTRLACKRQLDDLKSLEGYLFDPAKAERICKFIELLPHTKGQWAAKKKKIELEPWQSFFLTTIFGWVDNDGHRRFREVYAEVPRKNGKALCLDTEIPTPNGLRRMRDIHPGDRVYGADGKICNVVFETDVQIGRPCYEIEFSTGEVFIADEQHEWVTDSRSDRDRLKGVNGKTYLPRPSVKTTKQIRDTLDYKTTKSCIERNHRVSLISSAEGIDRDLPIDPYIFGYWLGDGNSRCTHFYVDDKDAGSFISNAIRAGYSPRSLPPKYAYTISSGRGGSPEKKRASFGGILRQNNLITNKHIPEKYHSASEAQRLALIQGLMDSDGYASKAGQCEFTTTSPKLRDGFIRLCASLGYKPSLKTARATLYGKDCGEKYRIQFWAYKDRPVFKLNRKANRLKTKPARKTRTQYRQIVRCDRVDSVPVKCIQVDSCDHTYAIGRTYIPTHNSIVAAGIGLYCLVADGEYGAEVYSGATSEKQAWEVFKPARLMAMKADGFESYYDVGINAKSLSIAESGAKFEPLIGNPGDGSSPSCAIVDEYHEHKTDELVSTMETGMGSRQQGLLFKITTAGFSTDSPCFHQSLEVKKMLDGAVNDDRVFAIIYHADEKDDWDDPLTLRKANPNYGVSVDAKYLIARLETAKSNPRKQRDYKTKHLNLWGGAKKAWLNYLAWVKCGDESLDESDFDGEQGVFSTDLSSKIDITADGRLYSRVENGKTHYYFFLHSFLPEETINNDRSGKYAGWVVDGWMETTEGNEIDFDVIRESVKSGLDKHPNSPIIYDPWRATQLAQEFQKDGAEVMEFRLTPANCTDAMKELEAAILAGRFHHNNNPVLNWMASNVVTKNYIDDMMKPDKEKPESKIDGMVALIMAVGYALNNQQEQGPMVAYI